VTYSVNLDSYQSSALVSKQTDSVYLTYMQNRNLFIAGATGYIGSKLIQRLKDSSYNIKCGARVPKYLEVRVPEFVQVCKLDCLKYDTIETALKDVDTAFYLVHSLGAGNKDNFEDLEQKCALNFAKAASKNGVKRIIYLGGLGSEDAELSSHLRSRQSVGKCLASTGVMTIELRASIILGAGSLSYELVRALCERLPLMTCPSWVNSLAQPIGVWSVLDYLEASVEKIFPDKTHHVFEIGGLDQVSYLDIMKEYCRQRKLKRVFIPLPFLTPTLSSLWLALITPVYARIGRKLVESLKNPTVVNDHSAREVFPEIEVLGLEDAIEKAIYEEETEVRQIRWSDSISSKGLRREWAGVRFGNRIVDSHSIIVEAQNAADAFQPVQSIGGKNGWYHANFLWKIRGFIDQLVGGVGIKRGRPDQENLKVGDTVDWWRVEEYKEAELLRLYAEMKTPGRAWLEFRVTHIEGNNYQITQNAIFDPIGLFGLMYWYSLYPLHGIIFKGMLEGMKARIPNSNSSR